MSKADNRIKCHVCLKYTSNKPKQLQCSNCSNIHKSFMIESLINQQIILLA